MNDNMRTINSKYLVNLRSAHGLSRPELSGLLGIGVNYVLKLEKGERLRLSASLAELISLKLSCSPYYLFSGRGLTFFPHGNTAATDVMRFFIKQMDRKPEEIIILQGDHMRAFAFVLGPDSLVSSIAYGYPFLFDHHFYITMLQILSDCGAKIGSAKTTMEAIIDHNTDFASIVIDAVYSPSIIEDEKKFATDFGCILGAK